MVNAVRIINGIVAVLFIIYTFVMSKSLVGLINIYNILKSDQTPVAIQDIPSPPTTSGGLIIAFSILVILALFWQMYSLAKVKKYAYWSQIIISLIIIAISPLLIKILQAITILLLLPKKIRESFGISNR